MSATRFPRGGARHKTGTNAVVLEANFYGLLIAPEATVRLGVGQQLSFVGQYFAKELEVRPGVEVIYAPYMSNAGVERAELFEHTENRIALRAHDLRSSFITVKLANGKSETWVMDRTGHTTSQMLNAYRRAARNHREASLGDFLPLHRTIPELHHPEDEDD